jgi:cation diffusion facilitator CzcD-associated flavoprotein CzcO
MRVDYEVGIVGAGFGGIIAAIDLKKAGRNSFVLFERAPEVGGFWRDNIYPGCACVVRQNLQSHIRFNSNVTELRFLENEGCWQVTEHEQPSLRVRSVIIATGPHSRPSLPSFQGMQTFQGRSFHSSSWDSSLDMKGKRVAAPPFLN